MASGEVEDNILPVVLQMLKEECHKDNALIGDQTYQTALRTLLRILRNIVDHPTEEKYRTLRTSNAVFSSRAWRFEAIQQLMLALGWIQVDDAVVLTDDLKVKDALRELEAEVSKLPVPITGQSQQARSPPPSQETEKDRQLSQARKSLRDQQKRDKEERRKIVEQINADRQENRARTTGNARARPVQFGAGVKRFDDIGVNLNNGGG